MTSTVKRDIYNKYLIQSYYIIYKNTQIRLRKSQKISVVAMSSVQHVHEKDLKIYSCLPLDRLFQESRSQLCDQLRKLFAH
jgi:hypothetical protein